MTNKLRFLLIVNIVFFNHLSFGQNWQWVDYLSGGGANHSYYDIEVAEDNSYIYAVGRYRAPAIFYGQDGNVEYPPHAGSRDAYIVKLDSAGNYQWVITEGGPGTEYGFGITSDEFGNAYMIGVTNDTAYFGDEQIVSHYETSSVYVAKYSPDGEIIWAKNWESPGNDTGLKIKSDRNGSIFITGYQGGDFDYLTGTLSDPGFFIGKLDYDGNFVWCKGPTNVSPTATSRGMALEFHDNHIYVGGNFKKNVLFDGHSISTPGTWANAFFCKLDQSGEFQWVRQASSINYSDCLDIAISSDALYVVGTYSGTTVFDTVSVLSEQLGLTGGDAYNSRDGYTAQYNLDGTSCYWVKDQKSLVQDNTYNVEITKSNNILTAGSYDFNAALNTADMRIIEYAPNGDINWTHSPEGTTVSASNCLDIDENNNYYVGGSIRGDYLFPPDITLETSIINYSAVIGKVYPPLYTESIDSIICSSDTDSIWLTLPNVNGAPLDYTWYLNDVESLINNDSIYTSLDDLDSVWCVISNYTETDTAKISISDEVVYFDLGNDTTICIDGSYIVLSAPTDLSGYLWSNGDSTNSTIAETSGIYFVEAFNEYGCSFTDSISILYDDCLNVFEEEDNPISIRHIGNDSYRVKTNDEFFNLNIFSLQGNLVKTFNSSKLIYLGDLSPGIYIADYQGSKPIRIKFLIN